MILSSMDISEEQFLSKASRRINFEVKMFFQMAHLYPILNLDKDIPVKNLRNYNI